MTTLKAVSFEEYQFAVSLGFPPHLPESLLLEAGFQAASWLALLSTDFGQIALVEEVGHASFLEYISPGDRLEMTVKSEVPCNTAWTFSLQGKAGDREIFRAEAVKASLRPSEDYLDVSDLRTLASEIVQSLGTRT